jgi:hypothetical protein
VRSVLILSIPWDDSAHSAVGFPRLSIDTFAITCWDIVCHVGGLSISDMLVVYTPAKVFGRTILATVSSHGHQLTILPTV